MIIDKVVNLEKYNDLNPHLIRGIKFLEQNIWTDLRQGRHNINGDNLFVIVIETDLQPEVEFESHQKYIDVHMTVSGQDYIGWQPADNCGEYHEKDDYFLFKALGINWFKIPPGFFALFFPEEAHAPLKGKGKIKKIVLKLKCE